MLIYWTAFYVVHVTYCTNLQRKFVKYFPKYIWPSRLGSVWQLRSRLECATKCLYSYPTSCHGYMYNNSNKLCTPCSGLSPLSDRPKSSEGDFYFHDSCQSYPEFKRYTYSPLGVTLATAYSGYFTKPLNYTNAKATCQSMHSHLFVAKSVFEYDLFKSIGKNEYDDWIGLDDMSREGHFVWADDGQEIDFGLKMLLFSFTLPDDANGAEDCAYKRSKWEINPLALNDGPCEMSLPYVCENPLC